MIESLPHEQALVPVYIGHKGCDAPTSWRPRRDSNPQPTDSKSGALSFELRGQEAEKAIVPHADFITRVFVEGKSALGSFSL